MRHRRLVSRVANVGTIGVAYILAFLIRFDFVIPEEYRHTVLATLPVVILIHYLAFHFFKLTRGWWRYVGVADFVNTVKAAGASALATGAYVFLQRITTFPRTILLINCILVIGLSIGVRLAVRLWRQGPLAGDPGTRKRILVIGAGDTGEALLREIRQSARMNSSVVAFLDDNSTKIGTYINGVQVVDRISAAVDVVARFKIDEIVVATPSASGLQMRVITEHCRATKVPFRVMPATWELLDRRLTVGAAREVQITDLLRRPPVALDLVAIGRFLEGKRVLVTGAAGSIGSEICRQVLHFKPDQLICLDHDENALFYLERDLATLKSSSQVAFRLLDITDQVRMDALFGQLKPQVIYHAAAHKHVPLVEANVVEGVRNNVFGTFTVANLASRHHAEAFVLISTDKAVNPTSVMGATKRISELLLQTFTTSTRYTTVRFGNVLGSQGSVVPLLKQQIAAGGPVTITHPDMRRYFMTIPEAVQLVIQSSAMGKGEEIFILDMGEPVRIVDLANDLITLSGLNPGVDVQVVFSGIRPGEKLYEELYLDAEATDKTQHPKIFVAKHGALDTRRTLSLVEELRRATDRCDDVAVRRLIPQLVPEYQAKASEDNVIPLVAARAGS